MLAGVSKPAAFCEMNESDIHRIYQRKIQISKPRCEIPLRDKSTDQRFEGFAANRYARRFAVPGQRASVMPPLH